jgi:choline monooxygenase
MIDVYPWGISLNVVEPVSVDRTRVTFARWVCDPSRLEAGAGAGLDEVEEEDERVVESTHAGLASPHYRRGRDSPDHEQGVHHFHRMLASALT